MTGEPLNGQTERGTADQWRPDNPLVRLLAGRWTLAVFAELLERGRRYQDLHDALDGMLTTKGDVTVRKTRIVAAALERLGLRTRVVERAFDEKCHAVSHATQNLDEPLVALAGFDGIGPRRLLGGAGFERVVDVGLGAGPVEYLDMVLHTFPATVAITDAFFEALSRQPQLGATYEAEIARQAAGGRDGRAARCGMLDIAGVTVGAAFVGTVASALAVADVLRVLHDGRSYSIIALDLREPDRIRAPANPRPGNYIPKFTPVASTTCPS